MFIHGVQTYYGTLGLNQLLILVHIQLQQKITSFANPIQKITVGNASAYAIDNTNDLYLLGEEIIMEIWISEIKQTAQVQNL